MKVFIVYYSMYGHIHCLAEAVAEGAKEVTGVEVEMRRVPETLPEEVLKKWGRSNLRKRLLISQYVKLMNLLLLMPLFSEPRRGLEICVDR